MYLSETKWFLVQFISVYLIVVVNDKTGFVIIVLLILTIFNSTDIKKNSSSIQEYYPPANSSSPHYGLSKNYSTLYSGTPPSQKQSKMQTFDHKVQSATVLSAKSLENREIIRQSAVVMHQIIGTYPSYYEVGTLVNHTVQITATLPSFITPDDGGYSRYYFKNLLTGEIIDATFGEIDFRWQTGVPITFDLINIGSVVETHQVYYEIAYGFYWDAEIGLSTGVLDIVVQDTTLPVIANPSDASYTYTAPVDDLKWSASDLFPGIYTITHNGQPISTHTNKSWNSADLISFSPESYLVCGENIFNITIFDESENSVFDEVSIHLSSQGEPTYYEQPLDVIIEHGDSSVLMWNATDLNPGAYILSVNGVQTISGFWTSNDLIQATVEHAPGVYQYNLTLFGNCGSSLSDIVEVSVLPAMPPSLPQPADVQLFAGISEGELSWQPYDLSVPGNYTLTSTSGLSQTGIWNNSNPIQIHLSNLPIGIYTYTLLVADKFGNSHEDQVLVTVLDPDGLTISQPVDQHFELGTQGRSIQWLPDNLYPDVYNLTRNGTQVVLNGSWDIGEYITILLDGLPLGIHVFNITLSNRFGFFESDEVQIHVFPQLTLHERAQDVIIEFGDSFSLSWNSTGLSGIYTLTINGVQTTIAEWASNTLIEIYPQHSPGTYHYNLTIFDEYNNSLSDIVNVSILNSVPPSVPHLEDVQIFANTSALLSWQPLDLSVPGNYTLTSTSGFIQTGTWNNSNPIQVQLNNLSIGIHTYTLVVDDRLEHSSQVQVSVTVLDPDGLIISHPADQHLEQGVLGKIIEWLPVNPYPTVYNLSRNDSQLVVNGLWISGNYITASLDGLQVGIHNFNITIYNAYGYKRTDNVTITVTDTTSPTLTTPQNQAYSFGNSVLLEWVASDLNPNSYLLYQNGSEIQSGNWQSNEIISYSFATLEPAKYNFTTKFTDRYNNSVIKTTSITIYDTVAPQISSPLDKIIEFGESTASLTWQLQDDSSYQFTVFRNGTIIKTGNQSSLSSVNVLLNDLSVAIYNYTIQVVDLFDNLANETVYITVQDRVKPVIQPATYTSGEVITDSNKNQTLWLIQSVFWIVQDLSKNGTYQLTESGQVIQSGPWENAGLINFALPNSRTGNIAYSFIARDFYGNVEISVLEISVNLVGTPHFIPLLDRIIESGQISEPVVWVLHNFNNGEYWLYKNGTLIEYQPVWLSNTNIQYTFPQELAVAVYNYTFVILDASGNHVSETMLVQVRDTTAPEIRFVSEFSQIEYDIPVNVTWLANDVNPYVYSIYFNHTPIGAGNWEDNAETTIELMRLAIGYYNLTLVLFDDFENTESKSFFFNVFDTKAPSIIDYGNKTVELSTMPVILQWIPHDANPGTFELKNSTGQILANGSWLANQNITYAHSFQSVGEYFFYLKIFDGSGNFASNLTKITIIDTTNPQLKAIPDKQLQYGRVGETLNWVLTELEPSYYTLWKDDIILRNTSYSTGETLTVELSATIAGSYTYHLQAFDVSRNSIEDTVIVTVTDASIPQIINSGNKVLEHTNSPYSVFFEVSEQSPWQYNLTKNGTLLFTNEMGTGEIIEIEVHLPGIYTFNLTVLSITGQTASSELEIRVQDTTPPVIQAQTPEIVYLEYKESEFLLTWIAQDHLADFYNLHINGKVETVEPWSSNQVITHSTSDLPLQINNFTLQAYDTGGLFATNTVIVVVRDTVSPIIQEIENKTVELGSSINLNWSVTDHSPGKYYLVKGYFNTSFYQLLLLSGAFPNTQIISSLGNLEYLAYNQSWTSNQSIEHTVTPTSLEPEYYTLLVLDSKNNYNYTQIIISTQDTTAPNISVTEYQPTMELGSTQEIFWISTDFSNSTPGFYQILDGITVVETRLLNFNEQLSFTATATSTGVHIYTIQAFDSTGNTNSTTFQITVFATTQAQLQEGTIVSKESTEITIEFGTSGNFITINSSSEQTISSYQIFVNGTLTKSGGQLPIGKELSIPLDNLQLGTYNYTILTTTLGSKEVLLYENLITLQDTTAPVITGKTSIQIYQGIDFIIIKWVAADNNPKNYKIRHLDENNATLELASGTWLSGKTIEYKVENPALGIHYYELEIFDITENQAQHRVKLEVYQLTTVTQNQQQFGFNLVSIILMALILINLFLLVLKNRKKQNKC